MKKALSLILLLVLLSFKISKAQDSTTITLSLNQSNIAEFVKGVERQTAYRFFYDPTEFDSLKVSVDFNKKPITQALDLLFTNTDYHYFVHTNETIILTKGKQIITSTFKGEPFTSTAPVEIAGMSEQEPVLSASLENKIYSIGSSASNSGKTTATLAGYVRYAKTGEPAIGVAVFVNNPRIGSITDQYGFYSMKLPKGRQDLNIRAIGLKDTRRQINLLSNGRLDIAVQEQILSLREVVISANKASNIKSVQMGVERLDIKTIKQVPTVFGEADVIRVVLTLPGVKSVGESSTGFNVRGGAVDQNLVLFNDATVYNPSHFFGFFSAFNPEVIKDVQLYKSSIPSKFGGRLSSVLEINSREGNKKKITGTAGLGLLTTRLNVEGPLIKDKTSFILGGRTTYSNWLFKVLPDKAGYKDAKASFNDVNLNLSHHHNEKNDFYFTGYFSNDNSNLASDTSYAYSNQNFSIKWKHIFNNKLRSVITTGSDGYNYQNYSNFQEAIGYRLRFNINQEYIKTDFNYYLNSKHTLDFGLNSIYYHLDPGELKPYTDKSLVIPNIVASEKALESAIYIGDRFELSPAISFNFGLRYSLFNNLGPGSANIYAPDLPKDENNVVRTDLFKDKEIIKTYKGPEYRLSGRFALSPTFSIKAGYNTLRQYIHMLTNTTSMSPTDVWKLSDMNIKPQNGNQISLGLYKNFKKNTIETSVEGYYKRLNNYLDYKSGATLVLNHNIEQEVINTKGKAYGVEFLIKKLTGKLNGWVSYTYSRTLLQTDDLFNSEIVNDGNFYAANYDKPHDFTFIGNYRYSHRLSFSLSTTYSTGRPITLPIARFEYLNAQRVLYSDRNQYRIQDYFRTDLSMNVEGNHRLKQLTHNSWTFGVYNLTSRKNAFANYFATENGLINGYKLSIFSTAIPFVNYNIRF